ncbi:MAG: LysE family transporter [Campylobacterales bacterium]|nr:LysE family transporter [Campylobacterales bacterium]
MSLEFLQGLLLGFGAAVPLGPINILLMNEALKSYKNSLLIGLGAMSADITYLVFISYGLTQYLSHPIFLQLLSLFGGMFLLYLAYLIFRGRNSTIKSVQVHNKKGVVKYYTKGYILTLLNPYTVLFWLSTTTYSMTNDSFGFVLLGMICAISLWITLMPFIVHAKRELISTKASYMMAVFSSIILVGFALSLIYKALFLDS